MSAHFKPEEFNCHCCGKGGDKMNPKLLELLEQIREEVGEPVVITSGYRCAKHNKACGGKPKSQHKLGNAADIQVKGLAPHELHRLIERKFNPPGLGGYPTFVHVDVRDGARARW